MDEILNRYVNKLNEQISESYDIDVNILNYYWASLNNKCQYVYMQGEKKDCRCTNDIKKLGNKYCNGHNKIFGKIVLIKHKQIGKLWHSKTKLAFDQGVVIGYIKDNELHKLTEKYIDKCIRYNFKYKTC
jgi:hypothetical protein